MPLEIERKFLVNMNLFTPPENGITVRQGYLPQGEGPLLVRIRRHNDKGYITLKGRNHGITRSEYEYEIPVSDTEELLSFCRKPLIEKTRYLVPCGKHTFEVDVFFGDNAGLVIAEIELASENEPFEKPEWLGEEVSGDARYYNSNLAENPYANWHK